MKLQTELTCPGCESKFMQRIEDLRPGRSRVCPGCGAKIEFSGDDGREVQKAIDDLKKSLKKLGS